MKRISFILWGDFVAFWLALFIIVSTQFPGQDNIAVFKAHIPPFLILYILWVLILYLFGLYDLFSIKLTIPRIKKFGLALATNFVVGLLLFYFIPIFGVTPKTNLILQIILFGIFSFSIRRIFYSIFSNQITRPVTLVGSTNYLKELASAIKSNPHLGLQIINISEDFHKSIEECGKLKNSVLIFEKNFNNITKNDIVNLYKNQTEIIDIAEAYERYFYKIPVDYISQTWVIENVRVNINTLQNILGRMFNIAIALIILVATSPLILIAIIGRLIEDGRPIFISQNRVGKNGKIFKLHKVRSMVALFPSGLAEDNNNPKWTATSDNRITPWGHILRKTHIDEIPQMVNVIKGDLNIVGPRPEHPKFVVDLEASIPYYELRHLIKPGFTGWAQIKYRYARTEEDSKEKFEYDLYYIKNKNVFMDFGIILRTIQIIFTH